MKILLRRMRIACWLPKTTNTQSHYVIIIAFPLQQCLRERASKFRYTYNTCTVVTGIRVSVNNIKEFSVAMSVQ